MAKRECREKSRRAQGPAVCYGESRLRGIERLNRDMRRRVLRRLLGFPCTGEGVDPGGSSADVIYAGDVAQWVTA